MNFEDWHQLNDATKIDLLREEVLEIKRLVRYGVAFAGFFGTVVGSGGTVLIQHFLPR